MTYNPNNVPPPGGPRDRLTVRREGAGSTGLIIGLLVAALVVAGLFFVWPNRTSDVATRDPAATGTTTSPAPTSPPTATPAPATPTPITPAPAPAQPAPR